MDLELRSLRSELSALREEVSALRLRVAELEADREFEVVGEDSPRPSSVPASPERPAADAANSSTSGYPAVRVEGASPVRSLPRPSRFSRATTRSIHTSSSARAWVIQYLQASRRSGRLNWQWRRQAILGLP